jgi:hypothetical protein
MHRFRDAFLTLDGTPIRESYAQVQPLTESALLRVQLNGCKERLRFINHRRRLGDKRPTDAMDVALFAKQLRKTRLMLAVEESVEMLQSQTSRNYWEGSIAVPSEAVLDTFDVDSVIIRRRPR